jgi:hypothetical protein
MEKIPLDPPAIREPDRDPAEKVLASFWLFGERRVLELDAQAGFVLFLGIRLVLNGV